MINVSGFPLCAKRLQFQRAKLNDDGMTHYWAAVAVATDLDDEKLTKFGGFDFNDMSEDNGQKLLGRLELFIKAGLANRKAKSGAGDMTAAETSIRAFLGSNGVKVSKLNGIEDYWRAARILWGDLVQESPKVRDVYTLVFQLNRIPKKQRPKTARANVSKLPQEWRAKP
ncbi:hypothetical protein RHSP_31761 [Rhizobium freirei PRF 81]|uniref:Uncharacterized protein n=1 Tax=Rhizobium freirei PRF 81 TaxID=363754 RepID=N6UWJ4_9HYPH|nr:hypothetical protein [Rhizobium freirei]ENN86040.1 hypothetical protein RHSP_31761 [Rhizobium freirei PRF 81]